MPARELAIGAERVAERRGAVDDEIIFSLEDGVAQRTRITGRGPKRQYRHTAPGIQEQLQDEADLAA
jgi:hypothetical protein